MKVAFVGLGSMGGPQARLLASGGDVELAVFDPFPAAIAPFEGKARLAGSPAEAAEDADIACVCVRDDHQVEEVIFGDRGLAEALRPGALVLVHSTIKIDTVKRLAKQLAEERGVTLLDAPVSRTRTTENEPFVATMVGGSPGDYERAKPILSHFSTDLLRVGDLGTAMALKISNNMVTWTSIVMTAKLAQLAKGYGVSVDAMKATMRANGNLTPLMDGFLTSAMRPPVRDPAQEAFRESQAGIGEKDLSLAIGIGEALGLDMSDVSVIRSRVYQAMTGKEQPEKTGS